MADLFSHALIAFALFTAAGWAVSWLDREWVVVGAVGSLVPDLNRIDLVLDDHLIESALGIPFSWGAIHTLGGVLVLSGIGALPFATLRQRVRAYALLVAGGCSHLLVDAVKAWADGRAGAALYPLTWWRNPTPGLYVSSDLRVFGVAAAAALAVFLVDRYVVE